MKGMKFSREGGEDRGDLELEKLPRVPMIHFHLRLATGIATQSEQG